MQNINRSIAIIRPKRSYIEWANSCSYDDRQYTPEYIDERSSAILIPFYDAVTVGAAREYVNSIWDKIFTEELQNWHLDQSRWPENRTLEMFKQWFTVELHSIVFDPDK